MNDKNKKMSEDSRVKSNLFADMAGLAKNADMDSPDFLKSLADLIESDEYDEVTNAILSEDDDFSGEEFNDDFYKGIKDSINSSDNFDNSYTSNEDKLNILAKNIDSFNDLIRPHDKTDGGDDYMADNSNDEFAAADYAADNFENYAAAHNYDESEPGSETDETDLQYYETNSDDEAAASDDFVMNAGHEDYDMSGESDTNASDDFAMNAGHEDYDMSGEADMNISDDLEDEDSDGNSGDGPPPKNKKRQRIIYDLIMIACILVFVYCVGRIGYYYYTGYKYNSEMNDLQKIVGDIATAPVVVTYVDDIYFPDELVYASSGVDYNDEISDSWASKYQTLHDLNSDCVGWLYIPDTNINYPVMYTPEDYDKYLYTDLEGNYLFRGLPFMAEGTLLNESQNYLIYGHNMRDGSAFHDLRYYLESDWAANHQYAYLNTAYGEGIYQLMDVVITKIYTTEDTCFKYYKYTGNLTEEDFNTYVSYMANMSSFDSGITAVYGEELITLSTCYKNYDDNGRLVVVFKRIQ